MTDGRFYVTWIDPHGLLQVSWMLPTRAEAEDLAARVEFLGATRAQVHLEEDNGNERKPTMTDNQTEAQTCGSCKRPFDPTDRRWDGRVRYRTTAFCQSCVDRCHDNEIADHRCPVCR